MYLRFCNGRSCHWITVSLLWKRSREQAIIYCWKNMKNPRKPFRLKMAPLVLIGTLITHLVLGRFRLGREGTVFKWVAPSGRDQSKNFVNSIISDRKAGNPGNQRGFCLSVFVTPLAGALFALEVLYFSSKISFQEYIFSFWWHILLISRLSFGK